MKKRLSFLFLFILIFSSCAQNSNDEMEVDTDFNDSSAVEIEIQESCGFLNNPFIGGFRVDKLDPKYKKIFDECLFAAGLPESDIQVLRIRRFGAFAVLQEGCGERAILFSHPFIESLYSKSNDYNTVRAVFFHELAHHLNRHHIRNMDSAHEEELADRYMGFQMRLIGGTLEQAQFAINEFHENKPDYPTLEERLRAVKLGFEEGERHCYIEKLLIEADVESFAQMDKSIDRDELLFNFEDAANEVEPTTKNESRSFTILDEYCYEKNGELYSKDREKVGTLSKPFSNASFEMFTYKSSVFKLENNRILTLNPNGTTMIIGVENK